MILTFDRKRRVVYSGGVVVTVHPEGSVIEPWCKAAMIEGYDMDGLCLDVYDNGAGERTVSIRIMTIEDACKFLCPKPKQSPGEVNAK